MYENKFPTDPKTLKKILESERDFIEKEDVFDIVNKKHLIDKDNDIIENSFNR